MKIKNQAKEDGIAEFFELVLKSKRN